MNDNGNKYALAALKDRRARIAGEIFALKKQIQAKLGQMAHLDATMVLFDPEAHPSTAAADRRRHGPTRDFLKRRKCPHLKFLHHSFGPGHIANLTLGTGLTVSRS